MSRLISSSTQGRDGDELQVDATFLPVLFPAQVGERKAANVAALNWREQTLRRPLLGEWNLRKFSEKISDTRNI